MTVSSTFCLTEIAGSEFIFLRGGGGVSCVLRRATLAFMGVNFILMGVFGKEFLGNIPAFHVESTIL